PMKVFHPPYNTVQHESSFMPYKLKLFIYIIGSQTGVRVPPGVQGVRGEKISAITENGGNSQNVPIETELQLSDRNIILCIKIAQIPLYFFLQGCISFLYTQPRSQP